eukprot:12700347-Alexandrium_andersonii.AAC.1
MSASLVGSEMCIRDSICCELAFSRIASHVRLRRLLQGKGISRAVCEACPVSYTHLTLPTICSV